MRSLGSEHFYEDTFVSDLMSMMYCLLTSKRGGKYIPNSYVGNWQTSFLDLARYTFNCQIVLYTLEND